MSQKASPTLIGLFVVGAVALVVAGIVVFGGGQFFQERTQWVAYFDESVSGLSVGAPVTFRGVNIGSVTKIEVHLDSRDLTIRNPVYFQILPDRVKDVGVAAGAEPEEGIGQRLIERGMRAQLSVQSFVTGQLGIQLAFHESDAAKYVESDLGLPQMPTVPSPFAELTRTLENISIEKLIADAERAMKGIHDLATSPDLQKAIEELGLAVKDVRAFVRNIDRRVGPIASDIERTLEGAQDSMSIAAEGSPVRVELNQTLRELSQAARSIRVLVQFLERHPDALLRGKRPTGGP